MKKIFLSSLWLVMLGATLAFGYSDEAQEGKELYLDAKCAKCHSSDSNFITKTKQKANKSTDYKSLKVWVVGCSAAFRAQWFDDEIEMVVDYLNEAHYKYPTAKK